MDGLTLVFHHSPGGTPKLPLVDCLTGWEGPGVGEGEEGPGDDEEGPEVGDGEVVGAGRAGTGAGASGGGNPW